MGVFRIKRFSSNKKREKDDNKKEQRKPLKNYRSIRGIGRAALLSPVLKVRNVGPIPLTAVIAGNYGSAEADRLDYQGKSDKEIIRGASRQAAAAGAIAGAGTMAINGNIRWAPTGAIFGAASGYFGTKKNTERRLEKRKKDDRSLF